MSDVRETTEISELDRRLSLLSKAREGYEYYLVILTADDDGKMIFQTTSYWVGWADAECRQELREARLVNAKPMIALWRRLGQPYAVVHTPEEMMLFWIGGGNALIEKTLAQDVLSGLLNAHPCVSLGSRGFTDSAMLGPGAFRHAPTPKLRMKVLKRDGLRCRICGRRPDDDVDIELHVHHIRPWERGGVTDEANLITLCHTCHRGLEPHNDSSLFGYIEGWDAATDRRDAGLRELLRGISNYRRIGFTNTAASGQEAPE